MGLVAQGRDLNATRIGCGVDFILQSRFQVAEFFAVNVDYGKEPLTQICHYCKHPMTRSSMALRDIFSFPA